MPKMNFNIFFRFFQIIIKNNLLIEKSSFKPVFNNKVIKHRNILRKELPIDYVVCSYNLGNDKILVKDEPLNFLFVLTLVLGKGTLLYEILLNDEKYICSSNLYDELKQLENQNIYIKKERKLITSNLFKKRFKSSFKTLKIISYMKRYLSKYKNIDFEKIHIVDGNRLENFVPNQDYIHFKIARQMKLPLVPLIHNNFIRESIINIYDRDKIIKLINPLIVFKKQKEIKIYKKNRLRLYNDISKDIYLNLPFDQLKEELTEISSTNLNKKRYLNWLKNKKQIRLSSSYGNYYLPLWKSIKEQKYLEISSIEELKELSGRDFNETLNFPNLFLQFPNGDEAIFKNKYLNPKLNSLFENITESSFDEDQILIVESMEELLLKQILNIFQDKKMPTSFKNLIIIKKHYYEIINKTLNNLIKTNYKINTEIIKKVHIEQISDKQKDLISIYWKTLNTTLNIYLSQIKRKRVQLIELNDFLYQTSQILKLFLEQNIFKEKDYRYILLTIRNIITIFDKLIINYPQIKKNFHKRRTFKKIKILNEINELFISEKEFQKFQISLKISVQIYSIKKDENKQILDLFYDIFRLFKYKNFSKRSNMFIILKRDEDNLLQEIISKLNLKILHQQELNQFEQIKIVKPNISKIKKTFQYNQRGIIQVLKRMKFKDTTLNKNGTILINIKKRKFILTKDYYQVIKMYKHLQLKIKNPEFLLFLNIKKT